MHTQNHYLCSNHSTSVPHRHTNKSKMLRHFYRALHKLVVVMVAVIWLLKSFFYLPIFGCKIVYQIHFLCRLHCTSYARLFIFQYRSAHGSYNVLKWVHCVVQWHRLLCVCIVVSCRRLACTSSSFSWIIMNRDLFLQKIELKTKVLSICVAALDTQHYFVPVVCEDYVYDTQYQ